jgi:hypothetical protein
MKRINVILMLLLLSKVGLAQTIPTFNKVFGGDSLQYGGVSITSYKDSIYFSMFEQDLVTNYQATSFIKTDPAGNQSAFNKLYKPDFYFSAGFAGSMKMTSDGYLVCGGGSGSLVSQGDNGTFYKFDRTNLDTVFIRYYNDGDLSGFYGCGELSDGGFLFSGETGDTTIPGKAPAWMVKTDSVGNELWQKTMKSDDYNAADFTYPLSDAYYQFWVTAHRNTISGNPADSAIFVDKYDNAGTLLWRDTFGVVGHDNAGGPFTGLREGGGVIIVNALDTTGYQFGPIVIYKFDANGNILWRRYINREGQFSAMTETASGDIVVCGWGGGHPVGFNGDTSWRAGGSILKLDKNGNTIFFQVYEYDTTGSDVLYDITETSDGGIVSVGGAYTTIGHTYYQRTWLLKVDSNGCLNGNCPTLYTGIQTIPDLVSFFVFPNPASSQFTIALAGPEDINRYHDLRFMLYDLTGRLVYSQPITQQTTVIQRADLSEGLYIWELSDGDVPIASGKIAFK